MAGCFPHIGVDKTGLTALPLVIFDDPANYTAGILDKIVEDIGAGVNGWTVHDDRRVGGTGSGTLSETSNFCWGGEAVSGYLAGSRYYLSNSGTGINITNGATALTATYSRFLRQYVPTSRSITYANPGATAFATRLKGALSDGTWETVASIGSQTSATMTNVWPNTTKTNSKVLYEQGWGYVVLKCTSTSAPGDRASGGQNFYIKITRCVSYGDVFQVQPFEYWNNTGGNTTYSGQTIASHTGYRGGPAENLRVWTNGYAQTATKDTALQYIMWCMPDTFALWVGGDEGTSTAANRVYDLYYCGNLIPFRPTDNYALWTACSNQGGSGAIVSNTTTSSYDTYGSTYCLKTPSGLVWSSPVEAPAVADYRKTYSFVPRGMDYLESGGVAAVVDDTGRAHFLQADIYAAGCTVTGGSYTENKRGEVRYLRVPGFNPSSYHLSTFGPADDGHTYLLVKSSHPINLNGTTEPPAAVYDASTSAMYYDATGFARSLALSGATPQSDLVLTGLATNINLKYRYLALPIDV